MKVVQTSRVTGLGRVYLGREVMESLGAADGDHIMFYQSKDDKEEDLKLWVQRRMKLSSGVTAEPGDWDAASETLWETLIADIN